jgi:hypothetical protein
VGESGHYDCVQVDRKRNFKYTALHHISKCSVLQHETPRYLWFWHPKFYRHFVVPLQWVYFTVVMRIWLPFLSYITKFSLSWNLEECVSLSGHGGGGSRFSGTVEFLLVRSQQLSPCPGKTFVDIGVAKVTHEPYLLGVSATFSLYWTHVYIIICVVCNLGLWSDLGYVCVF